MKISGKHNISASIETVWKMVLDPEILAKITPGIKELKAQEKDAFTAISEVKIGPVRGEFKGDLFIKDKVEEKSCVVELNQKSKMGNAAANIGMELIPLEGGNTEIQYTGEVRLSGMLGRMGQRIIGGVVKTLAKQFFEALEKEIPEQ